MTRRLACVCVPLFPLAARLRSEPELRGEAIAIFQGNGNAARAVAATRRARQAGISPGMSLPQARALVPRLTVRARDADCERAAQDTLLEIAESFSPRIENAGEGVVYLELDGLDRHFPGETPEDQAATRELIEELPFTYLHVFPWSPRDGTHAATLPDRVEVGAAASRARESHDSSRSNV